MYVNKMDTSELLSHLKKESKRISIWDICLSRTAIIEEARFVPEPYRNMYSYEYFEFLYNNFLELRSSNHVVTTEDINVQRYGSLLSSIKQKNINDDRKNDAFIRFTSIVLIYLAFIAKRPFHPVGMIFPGGTSIIEKYKNKQKQPEYYCPAKNRQSESGIAFCKFCICVDSKEL